MLVWEFTDYRVYLVEKLGAEGARSGLRKAMAEAIQVHTTYVSQVLKGRAELSLEQAEAVNGFFSHTEEEGEYFILLVLNARAGSKPLQSRFENKIKLMREKRTNIASRLQPEQSISEKDREKFYSSALYGALHVLCSLPGHGQIPKLAETLRLSIPQVTQMVEFLLGLGLLKQEKGSLVPGSRHVHLGNDTELILKHHTNWRLHCISSLQFLDREDLHYSAALSISQEDAYRVKEAILEALKKTVDIVKTTKVETAYVLGFDFYKL